MNAEPIPCTHTKVEDRVGDEVTWCVVCLRAEVERLTKERDDLLHDNDLLVNEDFDRQIEVNARKGYAPPETVRLAIEALESSRHTVMHSVVCDSRTTGDCFCGVDEMNRRHEDALAALRKVAT